MIRPSLLIFLTMLVPALAVGQTYAVGRIAGADGRPMRIAHAHLKRTAMQRVATSSTACDSNGDFRIAVPEPGVYVLELTGVDHQSLQVPLLALSSEPIELEARLAANNLPANPEQVPIIGDFNNWSFRAPAMMTRRADGTFTMEITTSDSASYQVLFPIGPDGRAMMRSVNGTHADWYTYDGGGDYRSVVRARDGRALVVFDPQRALRSDAVASITYPNPSALQARYGDMVRARSERLERFYGAIRRSVQSGEAPTELPLDADAELRAAARNIENERHPMLRGVAMVHYLTMKSPHIDTVLARRALREIPPTSPLWEIDAAALIVATRASGDSAFFERVLSEHPSATLRAQLMYDRLISAHYGEDTAQARAWYNRLIGTYPESEPAVSARRAYNPDGRVRRGLPAPAFAVRSIDGKRIIDNASLAGRYALLSFWTTWCAACVSEIDVLQKLYDRHGRSAIEILSVSLDINRDMVTEFRRDRKPMPWLHTVLDKGFESDVALLFGVDDVPKAVLIDPNGVIVAVDAELHGERFRKTMAKYLGDGDFGSP